MTIVNEKPLSSLYDFLGVSDRILTEVPKKSYDAAFVCDTGSFDMLGSVYTDNKKLFEKVPTVNIDHHSSCYGDMCWSTCGHENTSATMMVSRFIEYASGLQSTTREMATYLLLGVYYDTECFRNANTSAEGYIFAARMMELGADHNLLIRNLYQNTESSYVKLYGEVLANLLPVGKTGEGMVGVVNREMLDRNKVSIDSLGNELVNYYLRSVRAKFVVLLKEEDDRIYRMSFRSKDDAFDMRPLAEKFGGGGHKYASGACAIGKSMEEILDVMRKHCFE